MQCIDLALFRPLPTESEAVLVGGSEDDAMQYMDPEWSHLSLVYELLLHIVGVEEECDAGVVAANRRERAETLHHDDLRDASGDAVRLDRSARARVSQDGDAPHLRKADQPSRRHPASDQLLLLSVSVRDAQSPRRVRAAGDSRVDHQRVHRADSPRAQGLAGAVAHPSPQDAPVRGLQRAALLLHDTLRDEGPHAESAGRKGEVGRS